MKIHIGPYTEWLGPYQLAEKILFWRDKYKDKSVYRFGQWLAGDKDLDDETLFGEKEDNKSLLYKFLSWVDSKKKRKVKIKIDRYDTWNMDRTLALIILPMLKQLKETKHGSPFVDDEDVPEHLRSTSARPLTDEEKSCGHTDDNFHLRWDWVMDEMIWSFEQHQPDCDWESKFHTGTSDYRMKKDESRTYPNPETGEEESVYEMVEGPKHTRVFDRDGYEQYAKRISNGFRLFGKYYQGLWD